MKNPPKHLVLCLLILALSSFAMTVSAARTSSMLGVGVRQHAQHTAFAELPYGDGDLSYGICYELHDKGGFWRLGVDFASSPTGTNGVDQVITPHLNLVFEDDFWRGGVGILYSFVNMDEGEDVTIDLYWQIVLGISIPLGGWALDVHTFYVFEGWDTIDEFEFDELEFGAILKLPF